MTTFTPFCLMVNKMRGMEQGSRPETKEPQPDYEAQQDPTPGLARWAARAMGSLLGRRRGKRKQMPASPEAVATETGTPERARENKRPTVECPIQDLLTPKGGKPAVGMSVSVDGESYMEWFEIDEKLYWRLQRDNQEGEVNEMRDRLEAHFDLLSVLSQQMFALEKARKKLSCPRDGQCEPGDCRARLKRRIKAINDLQIFVRSEHHRLYRLCQTYSWERTPRWRFESPVAS